ncbi:hypothetical protein CORC01_02551 [Colletotrichum orchidophilum]|uniref:F-box domain-containing protein n=1 Tax=Colletotrichum orchidophilum TaxID=1209926 RepID=A0A1G4BLF4_9PEZI|nr:uncharacterized protein CORC01_02551 [Colletotrichum orchidophilum]OHF02271.1 hypothetical protein CORC01_02551 [Colletotrichum orchidophilum]
MELKDTPNEILNLIIGHLVELIDLSHADDTREIHRDLLSARLVCRQWNSLATGHLYHTLKLAPAGTVDDNEDVFKDWNTILDLDAARNAAQRVIIQSCPGELSTNMDYGDWKGWKDGEHPAFTSAIRRITQLPNVKAIEVHFSKNCKGQIGGWDDDFEPTETRLLTLKAVFEAIRERAAHSDAGFRCPIRSLTIRNLQNMPHQEFIDSILFKDVAKKVDGLHLLITEEHNEDGPDHDFFVHERLVYESHLQTQILPHFEANLTALTLSFQDPWGTMPGYFDGAGLRFRYLKTLNLANFVISNNYHFDWVLSQTALTTLRLDSCFILSYIRTNTTYTKKWSLHTQDWHHLPIGSYDFSDDDDDLYSFDGTWETIFDSICDNLLYLQDFRFEETGNGLNFLRPSRIGTVLYPNRYTTFDIGLLPSPWIESDRVTGEMEFGDNDPSVAEEGNDDRVRSNLNRSEETKQGDTRAFRDLLQACRENAD